MEKVNPEAVIFDVDGTIVNGNCTKLLIDHLYAKKIISEEVLQVYKLLLKNHAAKVVDYYDLAVEAYDLLSQIDKSILLRESNICFTESIRPRFNNQIVALVNEYQSGDAEIMLASGSPDILVNQIACALNISYSNVIASTLSRKKHQNDYVICIGEAKENAIGELCKKKNLDLDRAAFYSDNLTDIHLLKQIGFGYWVGSHDSFVKHHLTKYGIREVFPTVISEERSDQWHDDLKKYYREKKELIERSVASIFPFKCDQNVLDDFSGSAYPNWDIRMMQKAFFDPVNEYLHNYRKRLLTMGTCIFLEAANLDLEEYLTLLSIGDLLNLSNEAFVDISHWTRGVNGSCSHKSHLEISIVGNASIALLSLPIHKIIHNAPSLDAEIKLKIYEMYTGVIFRSLYGNGIKMYWEQQKGNHINLPEYFQIAEFLNAGLLQISVELFLLLGKQSMSESFKSFISNAAILIQLQRDQLAFSNWKNDNCSARKNNFNQNTNIICIHSCHKNHDPNLFLTSQNKGDIEHILERSRSIQYLEQQIRKYQEKVASDIRSLPLDQKYFALVSSYVHELIHL